MTFFEDAEHEELWRRVRALRPMTPAEKRAQAINWTVYNLLLDRPEYEHLEWELHLWAAKAYDAEHP